MTIAEWIQVLKTLGTPLVVSGISFWFIKYQFDSAARERAEYMKQDTSHDSRMFELAEKGNDAITQMSVQLAEHTKSIDSLITEIRRGK